MAGKEKDVGFGYNRLAGVWRLVELVYNLNRKRKEYYGSEMK